MVFVTWTYIIICYCHFSIYIVSDKQIQQNIITIFFRFFNEDCERQTQMALIDSLAFIRVIILNSSYSTAFWVCYSLLQSQLHSDDDLFNIFLRCRQTFRGKTIFVNWDLSHLCSDFPYFCEYQVIIITNPNVTKNVVQFCSQSSYVLIINFYFFILHIIGTTLPYWLFGLLWLVVTIFETPLIYLIVG